jgi:DNA polymerase-1
LGLPAVLAPAPTAQPEAPMTRLMLLDSNGLIYRGYHALPPLTTSKGELVNAVFGFCSILLRGIQDLRPEYVAACFDLPGPTFRHEQFAAYKATRAPMPDDLRSQFPKVREVVAALRIPVYEMAGYEADDVIGTITRDLDERGVDTTVVTGDLDMLQIVTEHTRLMTTRQGVDATVYYDPARIWERFELRPDQMIDYKALKGDPTDNIPGIPGVGEKTAAKLVRDLGSLEGIYGRLAEVKPDRLREKLVEAREQVFASRELSRIVRDLPITLDLEAARLADYDRAEVVRLFREFEFRSLIDRLPALTGESAMAAAEALRSVAGSVPAARVAGEAPRVAGETHRDARRETRSLIGDGEGLQLSMDFGSTGLAESAPGPRPAAARARGGEAAGPVDLAARLRAVVADPTLMDRFEATDSDAADATAWLAGREEIGAALLMDDPRPMRGMPQALSLAGGDGRVLVAEGHEAVGLLGDVLLRSGARVVGHETKPLVVANIAGGATQPLPVAFDTQIAAYLLNASLRSQTIADVAHERLDVTLPPAADVPSAVRVGLDALAALAVREPLEKALAESSLDRLFRDIEMPLIPVLAEMEAAGVAIDLEALAHLHRRRPRVQSRLAKAARADPLLRVEPAQGQAHQDRLFDRRVGPRRAQAGSPDDRQAARLAALLEASIDLHRSPAGAGLRSRRPVAHDLPSGRRRHGQAQLVGPEPPEHPDSFGAGPAHPAGLRGRRTRRDAPRRRLLADRVAHPGSCFGRRTPPRRLRPRRRHPPRDRRPGSAQGARRRYPRRAVDGQDGQLRARLRHERLRAIVPGRHLAGRGEGVHRQLLRHI